MVKASGFLLLVIAFVCSQALGENGHAAWLRYAALAHPDLYTSAPIALPPGDRVTLLGTPDGRERAPVDYLEIVRES